MIKTHSARPLYNRFQNQCSHFFMMLFQYFLQGFYILFIPDSAKARPGSRNKITHRQCRAKNMMHTGHRITNGHGIPRISMISGLNSYKIVFLFLPLRIPILHGHFQCHFYRNRTGISIKYFLHTGRNNLQQQLA